MARGTRTISIALLAAVVVLLITPAGALARPSASLGSGPDPVALTGASQAAAVPGPTSGTQLSEAIASLAHGQGPAAGSPVSCTPSSSVNARCTGPGVFHPAVPASPRSDGTPALWGWQNASPGAQGFGAPPASVDASMAWDALDQEIVYFGGCTFVVCPDNQTWLYSFGSWVNITNPANAPPAVYDASMSYDYRAAGVILFGGCGIICPDNQTWAFQSGVWYNESAPFCFIGCFFPPPPTFAASMVFANDTLDNITVLFGGCLDAFCFSASNTTWEWVPLSGLYGAWLPLATPTAPSARGFGAMAYDASMGGTLFFGGCSGAFGTCALNDTWEFYNATWSNLTAYNTLFGSATPPGRGNGMMTYDAQISEVLLLGGYNDTSYFNDTWAWYCYFICGWSNVTNVVNLPGGIYGGALASESSSYAPVLFSGYCGCSSYSGYPNTWVYEFGFSVNPTIGPNPSPARQPVNFYSNITGGTAPYFGFWSMGDGGFMFSDGTYAYTYPGVYLANISLYDFYGVYVNWSSTVTITGTMAQATAAPPVTDAGFPVTLSTANATGGTEPYNYTWDLGDATTAWGASVVHTYSSVGTYQANLTVVDAAGLYNNSSVVISVLAGPSLTLAASPTTTDVGMSVTFTPTGSGGATPYSYNWSFGDGATSAVAAPTHAFATAAIYHVSATVTDSVGATATQSVTVTVNAALGATANASASNVTLGTNVDFTAAGSAGTAPYSYTWTFGDGGRAAAATTTHAYTAAGTYTATVWVNDSVGGSVVKSLTVHVTAASGGGGSTSSTSVPSWLWWVVIVVVVLVIAAVVAMMMMRRKKPGAGATMPPSGASGGAPPTPPPGAGGSP